MEAMAAGLPVIGTPVGGIPDIIKDEKTGLFAKPDDPQDLAEKIVRLLTDEELRNRLTEAGRKMVEERFGWDGIVGSYKRIFDRILFSKKRILIATPLFPPDIGGPATYTKILVDELPGREFGMRVVHFGSVRYLPKVIRHIAYGLRMFYQTRYADVVYAQDPVSVGLPALAASFLRRKPFYLKVVGDYAWEQYQQQMQNAKCSSFAVAPLRRTGKNQNDISKLTNEYQNVIASPDVALGRSNPVTHGKFITLEEFQDSTFDFLTEMRKRIERFVARKAQAVVVPSEYLKKIVMMWGVPGEKVQVIYNSFEPPQFFISREDARKKYGLDGRIIVSAGRLVPWKGFDTLIRAVEHMCHAVPDVRLVVIGSGPEEHKLKYFAEAAGVVDRVLFTGLLSHGEVLEYFCAADCFVLASGYEGFSHTILEAMNSGVPVIASNVGGNPEIVKDGENSFLVSYSDPLVLRRALERVFALSDEERKAMVEQAQHTAQLFSKEKMIGETSRILNQD